MSNRKHDDDWMPWNADEYRAVVNPTEMNLQAYGHGRRLVLNAGEVHIARRACIQFVRTRVARKSVKRLRQLLEIWPVKSARKLLRRSQDVGFAKAYREITGRAPKKAGALIAMRKEQDALKGRLMQEHGVPEEMMAAWSIQDMRAVLKQPELAVDLDASGRPRRDRTPQPDESHALEAIADPANDINEFFSDDAPRARGAKPGTLGINDADQDGDEMFATAGLSHEVDLNIETLSDDDMDPEEMAAAAALKYDVEHDGKVKGRSPAAEAQAKSFKGLQTTGEAKAIVSEEDLETDKPAVGAVNSIADDDQTEVRMLRLEVEGLGGKWHPRSKAPKLREQKAALTAAQAS